MNEQQPQDPQRSQRPPSQEPQEDFQYAPPQFSQKPEPEEVLLRWIGPNRPFKKRNKEFFTTVLLIVILVSLILFFANQFLPIAVVISLGFLTYVLASVPPERVENKITTYGIYSGTHMVYWFEMGRFWFAKKYKHLILHIETARFPYQMMLLLDDEHKAKVEKIMDLYLIQETPEPTAFDKFADWLQERVPLDREEKISPTAEQIKKES